MTPNGFAVNPGSGFIEMNDCCRFELFDLSCSLIKFMDASKSSADFWTMLTKVPVLTGIFSTSLLNWAKRSKGIKFPWFK